eukprot:gene13412-biopygen98
MSNAGLLRPAPFLTEAPRQRHGSATEAPRTRHGGAAAAPGKGAGAPTRHPSASHYDLGALPPHRRTAASPRDPIRPPLCRSTARAAAAWRRRRGRGARTGAGAAPRRRAAPRRGRRLHSL